MDVAAWLKNLGLGQYETAFRDNGIGEAVLPHLTVEDLKEIGVATVGDRRMLLAAIAALAPPTSSDATGPQLSPAPPKKNPELSAERRPITVMFCDLVGSTAISSSLDAEDWRNLVNAYLEEASSAVTSFGGHVLKKLGDGLMALFGYPQAQENDAERAVRAALAIQLALGDLNVRNIRSGKPELALRIGIDAGPVVVEAGGEVYGDAPNIAARVQALAEPGAVMVTARVQRQVAGLFVAEDRGAHALKGAPEPTMLFRIVRGSGGRRLGARALTPLVGREEELELLRRHWERASHGAGQLTLIVGEPGIGKSRLVEEFRATLGETPHTYVEWWSSQLLQNTPLHPFTQWGRQRFGAETPGEQRLADLQNTLKLIGLDPGEYAPLIAPLVDVPLPEDRAAKLAPEELRRRQLAAIVAWFLAGARSQPVALTFEDLHWADPTSLDLMQALAERGAEAPLLILATARPEFRPPWSLRSHHSVIALSPLDRVDVAQMVGELAARHPLSQEVIEGVSERTGGVPLFVEEVARLLLERGEAGGLQAIPPTLQQSLAARLDRLGEAREVAQIGAVLGRDFTFSLLRAVGGVDAAALQFALDKLAGVDLLIAEGAGQEANYRFKHALIQDAAYDSLLKSRRQALHRRAAELLRDHPERAAAEPEVIAHHFTQAGLDDLAIEWWGKAGDQALRRSAFQEAIAHLGKAIAMADKGGQVRGERVDDNIAQRRLLAPMRVAYSNALIGGRGYSAQETAEAFAKARESAAGDAGAPERLAADFGLWVGSYIRGDLPTARARSAVFLSDISGIPDSPEAGVAHRAAGITHWFAGEYREAREHLERALALFEPGRDDNLAFRFGHDPGVAAMLFLALALWPLGDVARAIALAERAQERMDQIPHISSRANGKMHAAMFELMRGDFSRAVANSFEFAGLTREHELAFLGHSSFLEAWAKSQRGALDQALGDMQRSAEIQRDPSKPSWNFDGLMKVAQAQVQARAGDVNGAVATLDEALATSERVGHRTFDAELNRVRGEMLFKRDPANPGPPEEAFQAAIAVARQQGARSFELRAALALAKLYQSTDRPADAHAVLVAALEGFSPMPEMPEIAEAQALLAALAEDGRIREALEKRQALAKMHVDYARAVQWARGWGAEETRVAIERAHEFAPATPSHPDYWSLTYGRFAVSLLRGEFRAALEIAETYLRQAEVEQRPDHAVNARRLLGTVKLELGAFFESQQEFEKLLADWDEERDNGLWAVTGADVLCVGWAYMAQLLMILGEVDDAVRVSEGAVRRAESLGDFGSLAFALGLSLFVLAMCGRVEATLRRAEAFEANASGKGARLWESIAREWASWARGLITGEAAATATELRDIMERRRERQERQSAYMAHGLLAQLQGKAGALDDALASIAEGLALAEQTGGHRTDSFLHRVRGDILAARDPTAAEAAYRKALRIAQSQGARTFELQAAHALAKLLSAASFPVNAHAVLAPALEGFAATPEMREIAEAQALLAALAETEEVKAAEAQRQRRAQLHAAYGNALIAARGMGAPETTKAFARAREQAYGDKDAPERLAADYGLWVGSFIRGELSSMRARAKDFLVDVSARPESPEAGIANRVCGSTHHCAGEYAEALNHLERALDLFELDQDDDLAFRFGLDPGVAAMACLALALWPLGEIDHAASLIQRMLARAASLTHVTTRAIGNSYAVQFAMLCGDRKRGRASALEFARLAREHNLSQLRIIAMFFESWVRVENDVLGGLEDMRRSAELLREQKVLFLDGLIKIALAETEVLAADPDRAVAILDEALATCEGSGLRQFEAELRRTRGEVLLKRDPADPRPAEEALRSAIAVAKRQGTRSFELRSALSLAKLYQSTGRPADAHAVLAQALEGFSPTPEMPEIAEAQTLLWRLT